MSDESSTPVVPGRSSSKFDVKRWTSVDRKTAIAVGVGLTMALSLAVATAAPAVSATTATLQKAASPCSKVSGASVAAIVGQSAPAEPALSSKIPDRSLESGGNLGIQILCVYGDSEFTLTNTVTPAPVVLSAIKQNSVPTGTGRGLKVTFTSYSGLGVPGFRVTTVQTAHKRASTDEIGGISGKTVFAVGVQARRAREAGQEALNRFLIFALAGQSLDWRRPRHRGRGRRHICDSGRSGTAGHDEPTVNLFGAAAIGRADEAGGAGARVRGAHATFGFGGRRRPRHLVRVVTAVASLLLGVPLATTANTVDNCSANASGSLRATGHRDGWRFRQISGLL